MKRIGRRARRRIPRAASNPFDWHIPGNKNLQLQRTYVTIVSSQTTGGSGFYFSANPSSTPNFDTDFGNVFSLYKAISTTFHWIPCVNTNELVSGDTLNLTPCYTTVDPTQTNVPTTESEMLQTGAFKVAPLWKEWKRTIRPSLAMSLNSGNAFPPASNFWVSIGSDPQMNGLRMFVPDMGQAAATPLGRMLVTCVFKLTGTQ